MVDGEVIYVSADLIEDERDARLANYPAVALTAGMPVEVAIQTRERRAGDYFLEPLTRSFNRALREE